MLGVKVSEYPTGYRAFKSAILESIPSNSESQLLWQNMQYVRKKTQIIGALGAQGKSIWTNMKGKAILAETKCTDSLIGLVGKNNEIRAIPKYQT